MCDVLKEYLYYETMSYLNKHMLSNSKVEQVTVQKKKKEKKLSLTVRVV